MPESRSAAKSVAAFIEGRMIRRRSGRTFPISISGMIHELRQAFPTCEHTDEELERVIVANAVFANVDLAFDRTSRGSALIDDKGDTDEQSLPDPNLSGAGTLNSIE